MPMTIPLRDYQSEAVECVIKHFHNNYKKQLVVLPTGAGKTIVMAEIARRLNLRTLLIAHREELINQAKEKFQMAWPEGNYGICRASQDELDKRVVFGSVQSLIQNKRLEKAENQNFPMVPKRFRMHPYPSKRIRMRPKRSEQFRTRPKT